MGAQLSPTRTVVRRERRTVTMFVRSAPAGAEVRAPDGTSLGPTPVEYEASYTNLRTHKERRLWPVFVGAGISFLGGLVGGLYLVTNDQDLLGWTLFGVGVADAAYGSAAGAVGIVRESVHRRRDAPRVPVPEDVELVVVWKDAAPERIALRAPLDRSITVVRPVGDGYDRAIIEWAERGNEPSDEGLFHLGVAYLHRARATGGAASARAAIGYFERYLQTEGVTDARRAEVDGHLAALRPMVEEQP